MDTEAEIQDALAYLNQHQIPAERSTRFVGLVGGRNKLPITDAINLYEQSFVITRTGE